MNRNLLFALKLIVAIIMLQTLFYKFKGAEESIDLFTRLVGENEAFVRIGTGVLELIASILLFIPKKIGLGALLTVGLMGSVILSHLTIIGIIHNNDGGLLFGSAILTFTLGFILRKKKITFYRREALTIRVYILQQLLLSNHF
ncbi:DoxX family protein [Polaribacter sp. IC073]|uniref:DoxX family protein n=1 Tax=Polaribacter sp. IC073 TaxID=2508540 RepID=UPI0011BEA70D|nr:DoxX family protein [Polaribacter sp. IC073]TXD47253.1 DoxX family protein [Polaribacter sp. IC073]